MATRETSTATPEVAAEKPVEEMTREELLGMVARMGKVIERLDDWHAERDDEETAREVAKHREALAVVLPWLEQYHAKHNPQALFAAKLLRDLFGQVFGPEVLP